MTHYSFVVTLVKVCSKLTKQIRHGKQHAAFVFMTHVPHEIGKCVRSVIVHGSKSEQASERGSGRKKEMNTHPKMLLSRCRTNWFKRSEYDQCVKWITTMPHRCVDSFINRMQLRCRMRFDSIHLGLRTGRIRFRFRLASCLYRTRSKSDWRQSSQHAREIPVKLLNFTSVHFQSS